MVGVGFCSHGHRRVVLFEAEDHPRRTSDANIGEGWEAPFAGGRRGRASAEAREMAKTHIKSIRKIGKRSMETDAVPSGRALRRE